jgi:DNA polymerase-3 subunit alpha
MSTSDFVHLHVHSHYSLLDGACKIGDLVKEACRHDMPALALTDHGNLFGVVEFYKRCTAAGVKPLIGMEAYVAPGDRRERKQMGNTPTSYHLVLLAADEAGYRNLMKLSSLGYLEGFYYKPRVDKELLAESSEGLLAMSACLKGEIPYLLKQGLREEARRVTGEYLDIFGRDRFFLEVQENGIDEQRIANAGLVDLSREFGLDLVATNDIHFMRRDDARAHEVLLCINTGKTLQDENRMAFSTDAVYFRSPEEMGALFRERPEMIRNTARVAERCQLDLRFGDLHLPHFVPPGDEDPVRFFRRLCLDGAKRRYGELRSEVRERLEHEMGIIEKMGFVSYFLIVWDFIRFAKDRGIPVGPGRGSAAGSIVSYSLGITDIDPLAYGLIFERFLNEQRISMPDIDIDFCNEGREEVIRYVKEKYGEGNVAQIITFGTMAARGVIRDVGRVLGIPLDRVDSVAKKVPAQPGIKLRNAIDMAPELGEFYSKDPELRELFEISFKLEGLARHASTHAAGVVIGDRPLIERVPLYKTGEDITTQFAMNELEAIGLLKMDFLGLRTLTVIDNAVRLVQENQGIGLDPGNFDLNDPKTYAMLGRGESKGVFQLESQGFQDLLKRLRPDKFEDLIALVALYRPGPLGSGMVDTYIRCKHGEEEIQYMHPVLEAVLQETNGVILYQEQVMRIANLMAGFSLNEADSLRKAMGKKKPEIMARFRDKFIQGAVEKGFVEKVAREIFDLMEYFAGYGFNKSHSTAYAFIAFQTAYLKAHYPTEFMAALLTSEMNNTDKITEYIAVAEGLGLTLHPPDVNESVVGFAVRDGTIRYGLGAVKNVGERAIRSILEARGEIGRFRSLYEFCAEVDLRLCNKTVIESLIRCGAFDSLGAKRAQLEAVLENAMAEGNRIQQDRRIGQLSLFGESAPGGGVRIPEVRLPDVEEWPESELLRLEKESLGFYLSSHPLKKFREVMETYSNCSSKSLREIPSGSEVILGGMLASVRRKNDRRGNMMAFLTLEDLEGSVNAVVFASLYNDYRHLLEEESFVFLKGKLDTAREQPSITVDEILPMEGAEAVLRGSVTINLNVKDLREETLLGLRRALEGHRGPCSVFLVLRGPRKQRATITLPSDLRVSVNRGFLKETEALLGPGHVVLGRRG